MSKISIVNGKGEPAGEFEVDDSLLILNRKGLQAVHDVVVAHQAALRAGTADTKKRGEISGGGAKPFRQKGTGNARAGSSRSPIWRGGGTVFGPQPRDYAKKVPRKVARLAFRRALSDRIREGAVVLVNQLAVSAPKTRELAGLLRRLQVAAPALLVVKASDPNIGLAARNLAGVAVATAEALSTYQLVRYPRLVATPEAMEQLKQRLASCAAGSGA